VRTVQRAQPRWPAARFRLTLQFKASRRITHVPAPALDPIAAELLARLPGSPDAYPQKLDFAREVALLIKLDANSYRSASFLDDRILAPTTRGGWVPLRAVEEASRKVGTTRPVHFIFHTGHVGSTLVSRLLDDMGAVLSLREPLPLRTLADAHDALGRSDSLLSAEQFDLALNMLLRLWGRGYEGTRCAVVKATSSAGRLASRLLAGSERSHALYLNLGAEPYLATLLAGQNSPADLRGHGPERLRRLQARTASPLPPLHSLSLGELTAMSWLAETCAQHDATSRFPDRVLALDFDRFLTAVAESMDRIGAHFGLPRDARYLASVASSPVLGRYSKAPEYAYSPQLRADVLRDSRRDNADEIRRGMDWIAQRTRTDGALATIVHAAEARRG